MDDISFLPSILKGPDGLFMDAGQSNQDFAYKHGHTLAQSESIISALTCDENMAYLGMYDGTVHSYRIDEEEKHEQAYVLQDATGDRFNQLSAMDVVTVAARATTTTTTPSQSDDDMYFTAEVKTTEPGIEEAAATTTEAQRFIAAGRNDGQVGLWSSLNGETELVESWHDSHTEKVAALKLVDNAAYIYSVGHDGYFRVRSTESRELVHSFINCTCALSCMQVDPVNSQSVWMGSWDGNIRQLDLRQSKVANVLRASNDSESPVRALCLVPNVTVSLKKKKKKQGDNHNNNNNQASSDYILVVAHGIGQLQSWDTRNLSKPLIDVYQGHTDVINDVGVCNNYLYSVGDDRKVCMFDLHTGNLADTLTGHQNGIRQVGFGNNALITTSYDRTVKKYGIPAIENAIAMRLLREEEEAQAEYEEMLARKKKKKKKKTKGRKGKKKNSRK
jgi:hypothetical protein